MMVVSSLAPAQLQTRRINCAAHGDFDAKAIQFPALGSRPSKIIWSSCPQCNRLAVEREADEKRMKEEHARQRRIEASLNRASIPKRFRNRSFETYIADTEAKQKALNTAREFAENFGKHLLRGTSLVFAGDVGTGKGHLATSAAQHVIRHGHSAFFATAREIVLMLRASWQDRYAASEIEVLRMLTTVSLLVIDEVGVQFKTGAERDQLFGVIDGRYRDLMPTILTTNLSPTKLEDVIGKRNFSRLRENGIWVPFDWEDFRARNNRA